MSIVVYNDVILPNSVIAAGIRGKQIRRNMRTTAQNGVSQINVMWSQTLRSFEIGFCPMLASQWRDIEGLHEVTDGGAFGFLLEDPKDSTVTGAQGLLQPFAVVDVGSIGFGYGVPTYKLRKRVSSIGTSRYTDRKITRPRPYAVLKRDGYTMTPTTEYTVNLEGGTVTLVALASSSIASVGIGADTVLNFASGALPGVFTGGQRIYLSGISGTAATVLNGLSHEIVSVGGTSITITTATTGLTATGGTAAKYLQESNALTWEGSFYVPVHFANDEIDWELVAAGAADSRYLSGPSLTLMEIRE
jgi:uncharacterized protein (TIGR02217 family)